MTNAIATIERHFDQTLSSVVAEIRDVVATRPLQKLTEEQMNVLPDKFRCFSCMVWYPKSKIGGILNEQRICLNCYPYLDGWSVGCMIKFDLWHSLPVEGYQNGPKTKYTKPPYVPSDTEVKLINEHNQKDRDREQNLHP